jgi:hypothetical protein
VLGAEWHEFIECASLIQFEQPAAFFLIFVQQQILLEQRGVLCVIELFIQHFIQLFIRSAADR